MEQIQARRAARFVAGLPSDLPEPSEDEEHEEEEEAEEEEPEPMEEEEEEDAGFAMADAEAEYEAAQAMEMAEQTAILESIEDEAYAEAHRQFIRQEHAATEALFAELDAEEVPELSQAQELPHLPVYTAPGTEIVEISDDE